MAEAEEKTEAKPAAAAPVKKKVRRPVGVKVKNVHNQTIQLLSGPLEVGAEGMATPAELSTLCKYLEKA